jgi:hypothetical protein
VSFITLGGNTWVERTQHYDLFVQEGTRAASSRSPAFQPIQFRLSVRQRVLWAIGSPMRCVGFGVFLALVCWLGFVSIGLSAVIVILSLVSFGHWVPFALSGRNRLTASADGLHDSVRFRKRTYIWDDVVRLHVTSPAPFVHGVVVDVLDRSSGDVYGEFLRSSWRPSREEAQELITQMGVAGWGPHASPPKVDSQIDHRPTPLGADSDARAPLRTDDHRQGDHRQRDRRSDERDSWDRRTPDEIASVVDDEQWAT